MTALVLAGHGSHASPATAGVVWRHVDRLRARGVADEITACFWKEPPSFSRVLDSLESSDVFVVPVFTARGYYARTVLPAEMGLVGPITEREGRRIIYTPTLAEHPGLADLVRHRVDEGIAKLGSSSDTAIALVGHGTSHNPESRSTAEEHVEQLRSAGVAAEVVSAFLDDQPDIPSIFASTTSPNLVVVPFFVAMGSHVTVDVPRELGLNPGETEATIRGRRLAYMPSIGTVDGLCDLILDLARSAGMPHREAPGDDWQCFPRRGRDELIAAVRAVGSMQFGEMQLSLREAKPVGASDATETLHSAAALRERIRERPFKPLTTLRPLTPGWRVDVEDPTRLHAVAKAVYPGLVADWAANRTGEFRLSTLTEVVVRQVGMFRDLASLDDSVVAEVVDQVCTGCVRAPTWFTGESAELPCPEPCNVWMSEAHRRVPKSS